MRRFATCCVLALGLMALSTSAVNAEITYLDSFGSGKLLGPWGIAIHPGTLDVYVSEYGIPGGTHYDRVQRFDREGNFIGGWSTGLDRPASTSRTRARSTSRTTSTT